MASKNRNHKLSLLATVLFFVFSTHGIAQSLEAKFQQLLDSTYQENPDAVGILVHIEAPEKNISWTAAVGYSDKKTKQAINAHQPALIASNTKTYMAVAIVKLVETGEFKLDDSIENLITTTSAEKLTNEGYNLGTITIRHLLSHTSGIADYVDDAYFEFINEHPDHQWSRDEQIDRTLSVGDSLANAGEEFKYGDINYLLLSEIIEQKTEQPFYTAIRNDLIDYQKHELNATWFINLEEQPENTTVLAHHYWNKYDWDSYNLDPSWDLYGGGGLVSTSKDAARFFQLLFEGEIIEDEELLQEMYTFVLPKEKSNYCLGMRTLNFHGNTAYYHGGFWGTDVMHVPEINTSIAVFTLQKDQRDLNGQLHQRIIEILKKQ